MSKKSAKIVTCLAISLVSLLVGYYVSTFIIHRDLYFLMSDLQVQKVKSELTDINNSLDIANTKLLELSTPVSIDSGSIVVTKTEFPKMVNPDGCEANRGMKDHTVDFNVNFRKIPKVVVGIAGLDFRNGNDHRIKTKVKNLSKDGFSVDILTWCDTKISYAKINWFAYSN